MGCPVQLGLHPACNRTNYISVIVEPDEKQHYLSGIAQMEGWLRQEFVVPKDRNEAVVGQPRKDKKGMLYIPPASYLQFRPNRPSGCRGYPLHSRCWSFIERFIGEEVEKHLALLLRVLQGRYREIHCGGLDPAIEGNCRCWREFFEKDSEEDPVDEDPLYDSPIDPLHALTIQKIIRESKSRAIKNESLESEQIHSKVPLCVMTRLPPEIQYMFLDLLDYKDISKVRKAVRWPTDDAYWCTRAPRTILFELQDVPKDSSVDWEYLCLQAEKLLEEQAGKLLNRQRLLKHVEDITEIFRKELMAERKRTPSTNGV